MDFGKLKYHIVMKSRTKGFAVRRSTLFGGSTEAAEMKKTLRLTLIGRNDEDILRSQGLSELRRKRITRLTHEAQRQGMLLSYEDLNALLLSSVSTLKRDINVLEKQGCSIPLKGRRKQ